MKGNSMSAEANVGVVGLAAMGGSLARNLAHHGNKVAVFNRTYARTEKLMNEHGGEGEFYPAKTLEEFVDSLVKPRTAIIMVKAGEPTDAMINALADLMEPGDITDNRNGRRFYTFVFCDSCNGIQGACDHILVGRRSLQ